jgi:hypothetical protein
MCFRNSNRLRVSVTQATSKCPADLYVAQPKSACEQAGACLACYVLSRPLAWMHGDHCTAAQGSCW